MPATGATGARRSANHVRTHRKSSPHPQRLCVPSSQPGSRNEAERRGEPPQETSRQRCYRQCASRRAIAFPHRFPDAISSGRKYSQCGEIWTWITSRSEEHTSELQSQSNLVCRLLLEKKKSHSTELTRSMSLS